MGLIDKVNVEVNGSSDLLSTLSTYTTKVLKPNVVDGVNTLTQQMMNAANTKYVIKYDYMLNASITTGNVNISSSNVSQCTNPSYTKALADYNAAHEAWIEADNAYTNDPNETTLAAKNAAYDNLQEAQTTLNSTPQYYYYSATPISLKKNEYISVPGDCVLLNSNLNASVDFILAPNDTTVYIGNTVTGTYVYNIQDGIEIPANCIVEFDGGSISYGVVVGNSTCIEAGMVKVFGSGIYLVGNWKVTEAYPEWFGAKGDITTDDTEELQKCISTFNTTKLTKTYAISSPITLNKTLIGTVDSCIIPKHDGDVIRIVRGNTDNSRVTVKSITILCSINGSFTQPRVGIQGNAIIVGYGNSYLQQPVIEDVDVRYFYGNAYNFYCGDKPVFQNCEAFHCTGDGFVCAISEGYNNEALYYNTQAIRCNIGYNIPGVDSKGDDATVGNAPRCNIFVSAKAFGCHKNFFIDTIGCCGTIMSEIGEDSEGNPVSDELGKNSYGCHLELYSTRTMRNIWVDNGKYNTLTGYDMWKQWKDTKKYVEELHVNSRQQGTQVLRQSDVLAFEDTFVMANSANVVNVSHNHGDNRNKRIDTFEDIIATLQVPDTNSHSYFAPTSSYPNSYPPALIIKNVLSGQEKFINGFAVATEKMGNNRYWCFGTNDDVYLRMYRHGDVYFEADGLGTKLKVGDNIGYPLITVSGTRANVPTGIPTGFCYFATDLGTNGKPIWYIGSGNWVDATGATV